MDFFSLSWRTKGVFIATGVVIGLLVSIQFRSSIPNSSYIYDELAIQKQLIKSYIDDQALLKSKIITLRGKIEETQAQAKSTQEKNNLETLQSLKKDIGLETVKGAGVEINLNDGMFVNRENTETLDQALIHASDLRDIVNLLRAAKVEAIAINDQRVIATSPITSVGNTIMVNNFHLLPPFTITAIGDPELIQQQLNDKGDLPDLQKRVKEGKIQYSIKSKSILTAPVYNGNLNPKYLTEVNKAQNQ
jgi:uncharacterized protein YlxW (UPF0749 family)